MNPTHDTDHNPAQPRAFGENFLADLFADKDRFRAWITAATGTATNAANTATLECRCGDSGCDDTFGRATAGQDRSECCQYCGFFDCDVCGWTAPATGARCPTGVPAALFESDAWFEAARETYAQDELDQDRIPAAEGFQRWYARQLAERYAVPADLPVWMRSVLREAHSGPEDQRSVTAATVLRDAALYLERHGWIQGAYYDATSGSFTPPACMVGAIGMVCYGGPVDAPAQHYDDPGFLDFEEAVLHLDRYLLTEDGTEAYEFNDAQGRRLDDITHVLRDAATRPAHELIDALRAINQQNADMAAQAATLIPGGTFAEGDTDGGDAE